MFPHRHAIAAVALLCLTLAAACDAPTAKEAPAPKAVRVKVVRVVPSVMRDLLALPGDTEARHDVRLGAERAGRVEEVAVAEGQQVKKGQLIAKIDVAALKATLQRARASFKLADHLAKQGVLAPESLEKALTERTVALGRLREAEVHYQQGFVRAPINGRINHLHVDPGEYIEMGKPVADIVDVNLIRVYINVPELDVRWLKVGQMALVTIDAFPGKKLVGKVDFVAFKADPATRTFRVRLEVENRQGIIRPGMIVRVVILRRLIPRALAAPLKAIVDKGGERLVFVAQGGVARARTVTIGVIEGSRVQIVKGLEPGDLLIVAGQGQVEDGTRVTRQ